MYGVSLPYSSLLNFSERKRDEIYGNGDKLMQMLRKSHIRSIEIRAVSPESNPSDVLSICKFIWRYGMGVTVHGALKSEETAISDVLAPLELIIPKFTQHNNTLLITIHPIKDGTVEAVRSILGEIHGKKLPIRLAIENNRYIPGNIEGDATEYVLKLVKEIDSSRVGICFDMGHYRNYVLRNHLPDSTMPSEEFCKRVIHTHIHALSNNMTTHYPFGYGFDLPLKEYASEVGVCYDGVWNLELEPERWMDTFRPTEALQISASCFYREISMPSTVNLDVSKHFIKRLNRVSKILEDEPKKGKIGFGLVRSASYIFNENGTRWGMDLTLVKVKKYINKSVKEVCKEYFSPLDFVIVTHLHDDHYDAELLKALTENGTMVICPPFVASQAISDGVNEEKIITAEVGKTIKFKSIEITPTEGCHFRKSGSGIECNGFFIASEGCSSMYFPSDVRDYTVKKVALPSEVDYLFQHIWMGDMISNHSNFSEYDSDLIYFAAGFKPKKVLLTHLYENGRSSSYMWRREHAEHLIRLTRHIYPDYPVSIPKMGERYYL